MPFNVKAFPSIKMAVIEVLEKNPNSANLDLDEFIELVKEPFREIYHANILLSEMNIWGSNNPNDEPYKLGLEDIRERVARGRLTRPKTSGYRAQLAAEKLSNHRTTISQIRRNHSSILKSPAWFNLLKISGGDGSVSDMRFYRPFDKRDFKDKQSPVDSRGFVFLSDGGTIVISRPHFEYQLKGRVGRVVDEASYPLRNIVNAIEGNWKSGQNRHSFVAGGRNVDATFNYDMRTAKDRVEGSLDNNLFVNALFGEDWDEVRSLMSGKVLILNSVHGFREWQKHKDFNRRFSSIWPSWGGREQLKDRQTRLGDKK